MSVFDFSFEKLIGQRVIRDLYVINFVYLTVAAIICGAMLQDADWIRVLGNEYQGASWKALGLLIVLLAYSFLLIFSRVAYESIMIRFQMAEDIRAIRKKFVDSSQV